MRFHLNTSPLYGAPLTADDTHNFGEAAIGEVRRFITPLEFSVTPLHRMDALAREIGVGALLLKDESARSSLGSFKALGGGYAVIRLVLREAERQVPARDIVVTCATDGNHGRSVAAAARLTGCRAVIWVHAGVSEARITAIRELGAEVLRVDGSYDHSVEEAARAAREKGWHLVADTSWPGNEEIPVQVMQGYLVVADEVIQQCSDHGRQPTHVFLQAGVGGLAGAMAAHLALRMPEAAPRFIVVEPTRAACLLESSIAGRAIKIPAGESTVMAMLECFEPSLVAWRILERLAQAFIAIDDDAALRTMRQLAFPLPPDPFVMSGESGGAGLAGLIEIMKDASARKALGLDANSTVLVLNTEGATDATLYRSLLKKGK
jgi:diaminopropionate ammonia-lyase